MLQKYPKPVYRRNIKTGAKIFFVIEAVAFALSYGVYYKLNTDRDFRLQTRSNYPSVLDKYYKFGEYINSENKCRSIDYNIWEKEGKL